MPTALLTIAITVLGLCVSDVVLEVVSAELVGCIRLVVHGLVGLASDVLRIVLLGVGATSVDVKCCVT